MNYILSVVYLKMYVCAASITIFTLYIPRKEILSLIFILADNANLTWTDLCITHTTLLETDIK